MKCAANSRHLRLTIIFITEQRADYFSLFHCGLRVYTFLRGTAAMAFVASVKFLPRVRQLFAMGSTVVTIRRLKEKQSFYLTEHRSCWSTTASVCVIV